MKTSERNLGVQQLWSPRLTKIKPKHIYVLVEKRKATFSFQPVGPFVPWAATPNDGDTVVACVLPVCQFSPLTDGFIRRPLQHKASHSPSVIADVKTIKRSERRRPA